MVSSTSSSVSWIELFFDLVFVAAAHQLTSLLLLQTDWVGVLLQIALFLPLLWVWITHTLFTTKFLEKTWFYHVTTFLNLLVCIGLTIVLPQYQTHALYVVCFFVAARVIILIQYLVSGFFHPFKSLHTVPLMLGYACSGLLWGLSLLSPTPYIWWIIGLAIDMLTPVFTKTRYMADLIDPDHLPERFGLLTVIVIGEIIVSVILSQIGVALTPASGLVIFWAVLIASAIFASYFRFIEFITYVRLSTSRLFWYAHIPLVIGLIVIAAGYRQALSLQSSAWLLVFGMLLYTLAMRVLRYLADQRFLRRHIFLTLLLLAFLGWYYYADPSYVNTTIVSVAFLVYLLLCEIVAPLRNSSMKAQYVND